MLIGEFVTITDNTLDGPWHVGWRDSRNPPDRFWYIVNVETGRSKKMGPVRMRGTNHCDRAREEARRRNGLVLKTHGDVACPRL